MVGELRNLLEKVLTDFGKLFYGIEAIYFEWTLIDQTLKSTEITAEIVIVVLLTLCCTDYLMIININIIFFPTRQHKACRLNIVN